MRSGMMTTTNKHDGNKRFIFLVSKNKVEIWGAARVEFGPNKKAGFKKRLVSGSPEAHQQESTFVGGQVVIMGAVRFIPLQTMRPSTIGSV